MMKEVDEAQSEEEPSKSKISSIWSPFLCLLNEKWTYSLLSTSVYHHCTRHTRPIKMVYKQITREKKWLSVTDFTW